MLGAKSWMTLTVLPRGCAFSRRKTTRPSLEGLAAAWGLSCAGEMGAVPPAGRLVESRASKGLPRLLPVGVRSGVRLLGINGLLGYFIAGAWGAENTVPHPR